MKILHRKNELWLQNDLAFMFHSALNWAEAETGTIVLFLPCLVVVCHYSR